MSSHPAPSDFEMRTNATYEALMWALSRPGMARTLPSAGQAGIIEALIDRECAIYSDDDLLAQVAKRTGAKITSPETADHLFLSQAPAPNTLGRLSQGSDLHPEDGATLVIPASFNGDYRLRLTGPGVDGDLEIPLGGIPAQFWAERKMVMRYPMGFEIFLIDQDRVIGLPRSTEIEVL